MGNKKSKRPFAARMVNNVVKSVKKKNHETEQETTGNNIIKWIFGGLLLLAILYMIWTMTIV